MVQRDMALRRDIALRPDTVLRDVVISGIGVTSPLGIGREAYWQSLVAGRSGVRALQGFDRPDFPVRFGGEVVDFDPKQYVTPRKSLKVMARGIQLAFAAAQLALRDAQLEPSSVDPDQLGVVFGADMFYTEPEDLVPAFRACLANGGFEFRNWDERAFSEIYPLWMLKYLPNMPACHIAIALDARGPNNTIALNEVSSLLALAEAVRVIERGGAEVMITGGGATRTQAMAWVFREPTGFSRRTGDPTAACRPFDAGRDGLVLGEGAAAFVLETRERAEQRGAKILARVLGYSSTFEPSQNGRPSSGSAIRASIEGALRAAGLKPGDVGHVNANGLSTVVNDEAEARAIRDVLGDVPVTAPKSFFGKLGAATGAVEMAASVLAFEHGQVPFTLNYERPDPRCPVNVVRERMLPVEKQTALLLNQAGVRLGHSWILQEFGEDAKCGFRIVHGAVRLIQSDAEPLAHLAERTALFHAVELTRPDQRIDPLDALARGRRE
jgi:3-oxoacyl-[acyl-carrier-protein] synthase II